MRLNVKNCIFRMATLCLLCLLFGSLALADDNRPFAGSWNPPSYGTVQLTPNAAYCSFIWSTTKPPNLRPDGYGVDGSPTEGFDCITYEHEFRVRPKAFAKPKGRWFDGVDVLIQPEYDHSINFPCAYIDRANYSGPLADCFGNFAIGTLCGLELRVGTLYWVIFDLVPGDQVEQDAHFQLGAQVGTICQVGLLSAGDYCEGFICPHCKDLICPVRAIRDSDSGLGLNVFGLRGENGSVVLRDNICAPTDLFFWELDQSTYEPEETSCDQTQSLCVDNDGDGFFSLQCVPTYGTKAGDCNDNDDLINPGNGQACINASDNDGLDGHGSTCCLPGYEHEATGSFSYPSEGGSICGATMRATGNVTDTDGIAWATVTIDTLQSPACKPRQLASTSGQSEMNVSIVVDLATCGIRNGQHSFGLWVKDECGQAYMVDSVTAEYLARLYRLEFVSTGFVGEKCAFFV